MISVIIYGRNDNYGYNLNKRAAISINCIAEALTHPADEILFVDCNTPDDLPSFPESIQDTLTEKARHLLRIFRLRSNLFRKYNRGSTFEAIEPLSRNIAIRRMNPVNRWVLSTNTDMVFVARDNHASLSEIVSGLTDGFYELPRFEVPEALWEELERGDPVNNIKLFKKWGQQFHLNEVVTSLPEVLYDGPGDFQLMLREQIYAIQGFNEEMVWKFHVDSNLCKRFYILNGNTISLHDHVYAYHCNHTRLSTSAHLTNKVIQNSWVRFFEEVSSPYLPQQASNWGIPNENIEEINLSEKHSQFSNGLRPLLPGKHMSISSYYFPQSGDTSIPDYDNFHVLPYLANQVSDIEQKDTIAYFGTNLDLVKLFDRFLHSIGNSGRILLSKDLLNRHDLSDLSQCPCVSVDTRAAITGSDLFIFDLKDTVNKLPPRVSDSADINSHINRITNIFVACCKDEHRKIGSNVKKARKFIFIGAHNTSLFYMAISLLNLSITPYSTRIFHGFLNQRPVAMRNTLLNILPYNLRVDIIKCGFINRANLKKFPLLYRLASFIYGKK